MNFPLDIPTKVFYDVRIISWMMKFRSFLQRGEMDA
jgi:hypothetical protein